MISQVWQANSHCLARLKCMRTGDLRFSVAADGSDNSILREETYRFHGIPLQLGIRVDSDQGPDRIWALSGWPKSARHRMEAAAERTLEDVAYRLKRGDRWRRRCYSNR
jgi:hypothetical protein